MTRRSGLIIALLLALQLVLQPLGSIAWCAAASMGFGEGCCCASAQEDVAAPSCCSQEPADEEPDSGPQQGSPCDCSVTPVPATGVLPATADFESPVAATPQLNVIANLAPPAAPELPVSLARARAPGGGPPTHLLLQVFRL